MSFAAIINVQLVNVLISNQCYLRQQELLRNPWRVNAGYAQRDFQYMVLYQYVLYVNSFLLSFTGFTWRNSTLLNGSTAVGGLTNFYLVISANHNSRISKLTAFMHSIYEQSITCYEQRKTNDAAMAKSQNQTYQSPRGFGWRRRHPYNAVYPPTGRKECTFPRI